MSILTDTQKSALFGRLLGLAGDTPAQAAAAAAPERVAPAGTVAGTEPQLLASLRSRPVLMYAGIALAIVGVVFVARKLF